MFDVEVFDAEAFDAEAFDADRFVTWLCSGALCSPKRRIDGDRLFDLFYVVLQLLKRDSLWGHGAKSSVRGV